MSSSSSGVRETIPEPLSASSSLTCCLLTTSSRALLTVPLVVLSPVAFLASQGIAFRLWYVSRVFPEGTVIESVMEIAREMASYDRDCLAETKQLSISVLDQSPASGPAAGERPLILMAFCGHSVTRSMHPLQKYAKRGTTP